MLGYVCLLGVAVSIVALFDRNPKRHRFWIVSMGACLLLALAVVALAVALSLRG